MNLKAVFIKASCGSQNVHISLDLSYSYPEAMYSTQPAVESRKEEETLLFVSAAPNSTDFDLEEENFQI